MRVKMKNNAQSILEYVIVLTVVSAALATMSLYFRRGIQSVIKVAADEAGNQEEAEEVDPFKGAKTAAAFTRHTESTQRTKVEQGGRQSRTLSSDFSGSGSSTSISIQEK